MKPDFYISTDQFKTALEMLMYHYMKDYLVDQRPIGRIESVEVDHNEGLLKVTFALDE